MLFYKLPRILLKILHSYSFFPPGFIMILYRYRHVQEFIKDRLFWIYCILCIFGTAGRSPGQWTVDQCNFQVPCQSVRLPAVTHPCLTTNIRYSAEPHNKSGVHRTPYNLSSNWSIFTIFKTCVSHSMRPYGVVFKTNESRSRCTTGQFCSRERPQRLPQCGSSVTMVTAVDRCESHRAATLVIVGTIT